MLVRQNVQFALPNPQLVGQLPYLPITFPRNLVKTIYNSAQLPIAKHNTINDPYLDTWPGSEVHLFYSLQRKAKGSEQFKCLATFMGG